MRLPRSHNFFRWLLSMAIVCGTIPYLTTNLAGQVGMATLSGTVRDPSGAAIPGAEVTLESTTQMASRRTVTDSSGQYVINAILPGTYRLVVQAKGFEPRTITGVALTSGQGSTLDASLELGKAVQAVEVRGAPPLLQSTTATLGSLVGRSEFTQLPMLGRNFTSLINILPGVAPVPSADSTYAGSGVSNLAVIPSVYGQRQRDNNITLDGAIDVTPNFTRLDVIPPPEAIDEMKVSAGMDSGAFGWASGANINIVTKTGTNDLHGDAWEYLRNGDLNARSYFIPNVGAFQWNQFGAAAGGPIVIPHLLSRKSGWYVFGYYEGVRLHSATNYTTLVPTAAELQGNFSGDAPIFNPYTTVVASDGSIASRQQFANNQIDPTLLNQTSLALAKALYPAPNSSGIPGVNFLNTTPNIITSDQWSWRVDHQFGSKDNMYVRMSDWRNRIRSVGLPALSSRESQHFMNNVATDTYTFSPTFVATGRLSVVRFTDQSRPTGPDVAKAAGLTDVFPPFEGVDFLPPMSIPGYATLSQSANTRGPEYYVVPTGDFTKTAGRHTLGFGGGYSRAWFLTDQTHGGENFAVSQTGFGSGTGNSMASFLLGLPFTANRVGGDTAWTFHFSTYSWYFQDTFRATRKWTFNLGLRWDYMAPMNVTPGVGTFDINTGQYYWDHTNPITGAAPNMRSGGTPPDYRGYQPRVGIAYQINPKTVVRASFGIFDNLFGANQQSPTGIAGNWPYAFPQTLGSVNVALPDTFIQNPFPGPPVGSSTPLGCAQCQNIETSSTRTPYVEEWTVSLQRQIRPSLMGEAAYFGSHGVKILGQVLDNLAPVPGTGPVSLRVPNPNFPPYVNNGFDEFMSWYDGLSLKVRKEYSSNLFFLVAYTWSKTLDQEDSLGNGNIYGQPGTNPTRFNMGLFQGPAGYNITQRLSASYVYNIPGQTRSRLANAAIAHWQVGGIISVDSGLPYFMYLTTDNENIGVASFGSPRYTEFPNLVCNPNTGFTQSLQQWFNRSCYQLPSYGTRGDAGRHALYSDGLANWDANISKQWPFGENKHVEFRGEFFNFLNGHTFDPPRVLFATAQFGKVSATTRQPGRQIQFSLKIHF
jgi:Carboxypeptidase regulatory-like domain